MVVFAPQDALRDPPFSRLDLCTCRNLLDLSGARGAAAAARVAALRAPRRRRAVPRQRRVRRRARWSLRDRQQEVADLPPRHRRAEPLRRRAAAHAGHCRERAGGRGGRRVFAGHAAADADAAHHPGGVARRAGAAHGGRGPGRPRRLLPRRHVALPAATHGRADAAPLRPAAPRRPRRGARCAARGRAGRADDQCRGERRDTRGAPAHHRRAARPGTRSAVLPGRLRAATRACCKRGAARTGRARPNRAWLPTTRAAPSRTSCGSPAANSRRRSMPTRPTTPS